MCAALPIRDRIAIVHTRPESVAAEVAAMGLTPIICPALNIEYLNPTVPDADLYIVSSVHAVPFVPKGAHVITVGRQTELAAQIAGLECVQPYAQNASALAAYQWDGKAIHLGGAHLAPAMKNFIKARKVQSCAVYEAKPVKRLPESMEQALHAGRLRAVLMFSARGAQVFTDLALCATNKEHWHTVEGLSLSPRVADVMRELPYARIRTAVAPNRNALLEMLNDDHE